MIAVKFGRLRVDNYDLWNGPNVTGLHWRSDNIGSGNGLVPSGNIGHKAMSCPHPTPQPSKPSIPKIPSTTDFIKWNSMFNHTNVWGLISKMICLWLRIVLIVVVYFSELIGSRRLTVVILLVLEPPLWLLWNIRLAEIKHSFSIIEISFRISWW